MIYDPRVNPVHALFDRYIRALDEQLRDPTEPLLTQHRQETP